jgi:prepilin peptidase CpaA
VTTLLAALLIATVTTAAVSDVRSRRIPNLLTASACLIALALRSFIGGGAVLEGMMGVGVALLILLPIFAFGGLGGGDVKLLVAIGAFLGPKGFLLALGVTAIAGGAMSIGAAVRARALLPALFGTGDLVKYCLSIGRRGRAVTVDAMGTTVPYGVAIMIGAVAALGVERWL